MKPTIRRSRPLALPSVLALATILGAAPAWAQVQVEPPLVEWANKVWTSARQRDPQLRTLLRELPADAQAEYVTRYRESLELHQTNQVKATDDRVKSRDEALAELHTKVADGQVTAALRSAIKVQDLSEDFSAILGEPEVVNLVAAAEAELPKAEQEGDWLQAQELLFLLRTLHEDTDAHLAYDELDRRLSAVNRRVTLLSQYAPRVLHDLRVRAAERAGEPVPDPFNPATVVPWEERVDGIDAAILRGALRLAASEHIETDATEGWRILMRGGLEGLKIMATTPGMAESFPDLADADRVGRWVAALDARLRTVNAAAAADLGRSMLVELIDDVVRDNGLTVHLPPPVVYREFGDGAMYKLDELYHDPYSEIVWPVELRRFRQQTEGNFIGVGILIRHNEKREIQVVNPLEGTPAYFAGVKPDDVIVEVDNEPAVGWSLNDAVDRITGPKGEHVTLGLRREGNEELIPLAIVRDIIKLRTVKGWWKERLGDDGEPTWDWYVDPLSRIAYIRLTQFTEDSYADIREAWAQISDAGRPNGIILDLRYNPGGLLTAAVDVANLFVQKGLIVSGEDKYGQKAFPDQMANPRHAEFLGVPTVVLINKGSASASEIVAGCLQAHGSAIVVGERSYGKGSVQTVHHITNKAKMKLTTHFYRLPAAPGQDKGRLVHKRPGAPTWGVDPDIEVKMTSVQVADSLKMRQDADIIPEDELGKPDPESAKRPKVRELLDQGLDPQLQTALLILQARALADLSRLDHHARK